HQLSICILDLGQSKFPVLRLRSAPDLQTPLRGLALGPRQRQVIIHDLDELFLRHLAGEEIHDGMPPLTGSKSEKLRATIIAMLTGKIGDAFVLAGPIEPVAGYTSHQKARERRRLGRRGWRYWDKSDGGG